MLLAVAKVTVTGDVVVLLSMTVKTSGVVIGSPSMPTTSFTVTLGGASSSRMVPSPMGSTIVALIGLESSTKNFSSGSTSVSPIIGTVTNRVTWPGVKTTFVLVCTKST